MLDVRTLQIVLIVVVSVIAAVFVAEVARRGRSPVDLVWTLALSAAVAAAMFHLTSDSSQSLWWFVALGNACSVVTTMAMWNGVRADDGRRPLLGVTAAAALLTALVALAAGADEVGDVVWVSILGTAAGAILGGAEGLRGRLRSRRPGRALSVALLVAGGYHVLRLVVYLVAGPDSAFTEFLGPSTTLLVLLVLLTTAGCCMIVVRGDEVATLAARSSAFDARTGLRTPVTFVPRARDAVREAQRAGDPVTVVVVFLEGRGDLATAFDREVAESALSAVVDTARLLAPPAASLAGRADEAEEAFEVLLRGHTGTEGHVWAETLRRRVIANPIEVDGARVRLRLSLGVASDAEAGYDLAALRGLAAQRAERACTEGGNRTLGWF